MHGNEGLVGTMPSELAQLTLAKQILMHDTNIVGTIPASLASLGTLTNLTLPITMTGSIPNELCGVLQEFSFMDCEYVFHVRQSNCYIPVTDKLNCETSMFCGCDCEACA